MAAANSTGVRSRADHPGRIAPVTTLSASGWFPAAHDGDSDPNMDEALRRALRRSANAVAAVESDKQRAIADQVELAYAEYADQYRTEVRDYLGSAA